VIALSSDDIKKDFIYIALAFIISLVLFKIVFYDEKFIIILRLSFALFYQFVPGFFLTYVFFNNPKLIQKFILGFGFTVIFFPLIGYYLGILGLDIKFYWPLFIILAVPGIYCAYKQNPENKNNNTKE